jgi:dolichol-phosphate mannosyltransferase
VRGGGAKNWSLPRRTLSFGANLYARLFTGVPVHDMTAGFVGYRTEVLREINLDEIRSEGYAFLMEMKFTLHRSGATFCEFPIIFRSANPANPSSAAKSCTKACASPSRGWGKRIAGHHN